MISVEGFKSLAGYYVVYKYCLPLTNVFFSGSVTQTAVRGLKAGVAYHFKVAAVTGGGTGPSTPTLTIQTTTSPTPGKVTHTFVIQTTTSNTPGKVTLNTIQTTTSSTTGKCTPTLIFKLQSFLLQE